MATRRRLLLVLGVCGIVALISGALLTIRLLDAQPPCLPARSASARVRSDYGPAVGETMG